MNRQESKQNILSSLLLCRQGKDSLLPGLLAEKAKTRKKAQLQLLKKAVSCGWEGNLWAMYLAEVLASAENPFSLCCERRPAAKDSLYTMAEKETQVFYELMQNLPSEDFPAEMADFHLEQASKKSFENARILRFLTTASSADDLQQKLTQVYKERGTGVFGKEFVFKLAHEEGPAKLLPTENRKAVSIDDLVGYESQKKLLLENTEAFVRGKGANNVLLYGDAGTGKSTSVQALADHFGKDGLRIIEICTDQYPLIPELMQLIKTRNYRFILFFDDLSFEEDETGFKFLKAVLEGGAEAAPENVRIYATSNRRHLIRETWNDRNDMEKNGDVHRSDTMEEKLSLSTRFGLQIFYPAPGFAEYQDIVAELARRGRITGMTQEELLKASATWQVRSGSRCGRTAKQFIESLSCDSTANS